MWAGAGPERSLTWAVLMTLVEAAILWVGLRCRRALATGAATAGWKRAHFVLAAVAGVTWGLAVWFVWQPDALPFYLATMTILVGVAGVSMVTMASYGAASLLFFGGIYLVPLLHSFLHPVPTSAQIQVGLLVGWLVQLTYTRELGRVVVRGFEHQDAFRIKQFHEAVDMLDTALFEVGDDMVTADAQQFAVEA